MTFIVTVVQSDSPQNQEPFAAVGGQQVELLMNECNEKPCLNGGTCTSELFGFDCECAPGYTGIITRVTFDLQHQKACLRICMRSEDSDHTVHLQSNRNLLWEHFG